MQTIEADGRPIMTIAAERDELYAGDLLDRNGPVFADMIVLAGVSEQAELRWRDPFDEEHDAWTRAAQKAVRVGDYDDLYAAREGNFAVWLVPISDPTDDD